jgi:gliding motility-associated-like protein
MSLNRKAYLTLLFIFLHCFISVAQKVPSIWYFGDFNGLDFRSGVPVATSNPNISIHGPEIRGIATVTDANGNILFYAGDETVYNRNDNVMLNGAGVNGSWAAAQGYLTVRAIHDTTLYYIFTVDYYAGPKGMSYSIVDMKEDNGLGAITTKNARLLQSSTEQLCAVKHCNGKDIWVITHGWNSDAYHAFLITASGISVNPVVSHSGRWVGVDDTGLNNTFAYMKTSPDGKKIAATFSVSGLDLSDFDNATGKVSNSVDLKLMTATFSTQANGVEFSPNSKLLYANYFQNNTWNIIYQYDIYAGSTADVIATRTLIASDNFFGYFASMQTGPDGKIYVANYGYPYVAVIKNPDVRGIGCNFELEAVALARRCSHGFPAYLETKYYPETFFTYEEECDQRVSVHYEKPENIISIKWDFGDPSSGAANNSTNENAAHEYAKPGNYQVKLIRYKVCDSDTLEEEINIKGLTVNIGNDTAVCGNNGYYLNPVTSDNVDYLWQDGSSGNNMLVNNSGLYWLQVTDRSTGCSLRDSMQVNVQPGNCKLAVPNVFTPNGDGKNDVFIISKTALLSSFSMQIFNRWGQKVYESRDQNKGWNGMLGNKFCDVGNYPYVITYNDTNSGAVILKGVLLLVR